ncbi:hypothetical protein [Streptomyces sp. NPDC002758]
MTTSLSNNRHWIQNGTGLHKDCVRGRHQLQWIIGEFVQQAGGGVVAAAGSGAATGVLGIRGTQGAVGGAGGQEGSGHLVLGGLERVCTLTGVIDDHGRDIK